MWLLIKFCHGEDHQLKTAKAVAIEDEHRHKPIDSTRSGL